MPEGQHNLHGLPLLILIKLHAAGQAGMHNVMLIMSVYMPSRWCWRGRLHLNWKACCRLVVTAEGFDGRLVHAAQHLISMQQAKWHSPETYAPTLGRPCSILCNAGKASI